MELCLARARGESILADSVNCCLLKTHFAEDDQNAVKNYPQLRRKHKGFVYVKASLVKGNSRRIEIVVKPRSNSKPVCDGCGQPGGTYDTQPQRKFSYVPLWNIAVFFLYAPRRVNCRNCKRVVIERIPWAEGKCRMTNTYKLFLANWAKRLSWKETAEIFSTSWSSVYRAVKWCVCWGLVHRTLTNIESIGVTRFNIVEVIRI